MPGSTLLSELEDAAKYLPDHDRQVRALAAALRARAAHVRRMLEVVAGGGDSPTDLVRDAFAMLAGPLPIEPTGGSGAPRCKTCGGTGRYVRPSPSTTFGPEMSCPEPACPHRRRGNPSSGEAG